MIVVRLTEAVPALNAMAGDHVAIGPEERRVVVYHDVSPAVGLAAVLCGTAWRVVEAPEPHSGVVGALKTLAAAWGVKLERTGAPAPTQPGARPRQRASHLTLVP